MASSPSRWYDRVACYVDGFNLYHGLYANEKSRPYRWLDLWSFASSFVQPGEILGRVVYCTAVPEWNPGKRNRHEVYIDALKTRGIDVVTGRFQSDHTACRATCKELYEAFIEKMTDVNLATTILIDAVEDQFDRVLLISGDSDQVPTVKLLQEKLMRPVTVVFPPRRESNYLRDVAAKTQRIGWKLFKEHQLPLEICTNSGRVLRRPGRWDPAVMQATAAARASVTPAAAPAPVAPKAALPAAPTGSQPRR